MGVRTDLKSRRNCSHPKPAHLEGLGTVGNERRPGLGDTVRKREFEVGDHQLLDVWTTDVVGLLDLHDAEDLFHQGIRLYAQLKQVKHEHG